MDKQFRISSQLMRVNSSPEQAQDERPQFIGIEPYKPR